MSTPGIAQRRILIVDDEPFVCDAVKMMLAFDGHQVDAACSANDALALFEAGKYDLVITDYSMPKMKGDALAAAIAANDPVAMAQVQADLDAAATTLSADNAEAAAAIVANTPNA